MTSGEPLMPEPSTFDVEMIVEKIKIYTSPGIYHIIAEVFKL